MARLHVDPLTSRPTGSSTPRPPDEVLQVIARKVDANLHTPRKVLGERSLWPSRAVTPRDNTKEASWVYTAGMCANAVFAPTAWAGVRGQLLSGEKAALRRPRLSRGISKPQALNSRAGGREAPALLLRSGRGAGHALIP